MLRRSTAFLEKRGSDTARLDAEVLIAHALGCERIELYTRHDQPLTPGERDAARRVVARRGRREPVAHIVGRRAFRGIELRSTPAALVPRPETELVVERALARSGDGAEVLDWGTGSGAIALALAAERPDLIVVGAERSAPALALAEANASQLALDVEWVRSAGFGALAGRLFDVVVANPPYLSEDELRAAPPELAFEPEEALCAGPRGTEALEQLVRDAPPHLRPGGWLIAEIGAEQGEAAAALWREGGFLDVVVHVDLAGLPRVVEGRA